MYQRLNKYQYWLDILALLGLVVFIFPLSYFGYKIVYSSITRHSLANTPLQTPLVIPQSIWLVGFVFFAIVLLVYLLVMLVSRPKKLLKQLLEQ